MGQRFYKVRGNTLEDAYRRMRAKLGPNAIVLSTNQVTEGGIFGMLGRKVVEITASVPGLPDAPVERPRSMVERKYVENSRLDRPAEDDAKRLEYERMIRDAQRRMGGAPPVAGRAETPAPPVAEGGAAPMLAFPKRKPAPEAAGEDLRREVQEIREMMQVIYAESPGAGLPTEFAPHYRALVRRGVSRKAAAALVAGVLKNGDLSVLRDPRVFTERLHFEIRRAIRATGGIALHGGQCRIVALCGPTGVGKTTNLAKIAAHFAVNERARVALLTCDTYRVAASEQLRIYANIIGLPLRVANDPREAADAARDFRDYDLILMDTAGGSQFNLEQINELKTVLHAVRPHETLLVMSATTQIEDLRNVVANFKCLQPTAALFTKTDETRQYGAMFSIMVETDLPLSYVSIGQNVPDDIRPASPAMIANLILEGKDHRG